VKNPKYAPSLTVSDVNLASALATYYVPPDPRGFEDHFEENGRRYYCWHFLDRTSHTGELTQELIAAWADPEAFNEKFPNHPFSFIMLYERNRQGLRERCTKNAPKLLVRKGPSLAVVDPKQSREDQEYILAKIGI
tara:strand:+ start:6815 stop:7222 length:408 start_codon:yes stop_codon:yes gene_type:complete